MKSLGLRSFTARPWMLRNAEDKGEMGMDGALRLWVDGGTTNTRFTLTRGEEVVERTCRRVGAANADLSLRNAPLAAAVADEIAALESRHGARIERICASGMITSQNGLLEVPHLSAPAGLYELARGVRTVRLAEVSQTAPVDFIPGVRCGEGMAADVMRGEETEIMGWKEKETGNRLFLHFGSHNKAILVKEGRIVQSLTTLSGELLYAVTHDTILRSAAGGEPPAVFLAEDAERGFEAAVAGGATRALFEARLYAIQCDKTPAQVYAFLVGALVQQDLLAFEPLLRRGADEIVLYGREAFVRAFLSRLRAENTRTVSHQDSEWLSFHGMRRIMRAREQMEDVSKW